MHVKKTKKRRSSYNALLGTLAVLAVIAVVFVLLHRETKAPRLSTTASQTTKADKKAALLLPGASTPIPLPVDKANLASPTGQLAFVNKDRPIDLAYIPSDLVLPNVAYRTDKSRSEVMVRSALLEPLAGMFAAAKKDGVELMIGSAYRSSELQATYFNSYVRSSGLKEAEKFSAHPGTSEHQLGLAVDLTATDRQCYLVECFETTPAGAWLASHAHEYGFILRYPKGKEAITKYQYEPWHFRYVGLPLAKAIYESGLTYEEVYPYLTGEKQP